MCRLLMCERSAPRWQKHNRQKDDADSPFWGRAAAASGSPLTGWLCQWVWRGSCLWGNRRGRCQESFIYTKWNNNDSLANSQYSLSSCVCVCVSEAYSAPSAAPSASTTRLVSSLEICRASTRCMSVMVQKDATRWSGKRTGEVMGHDLPLTSKTGNLLN